MAPTEEEKKMMSANFSKVESAKVVITGWGIKIALTVGKKTGTHWLYQGRREHKNGTY